MGVVMRVLVLGGTLFLGRHLVEAAVQRGFDVTMFTRGKTNPNAYPGVRRITGDRHGDLSELGEETWDVVVDTWAREPSLVRAAASTLSSRTGTFVFVSSMSVYGPGTPQGFDESSRTLPPAAADRPSTPEGYGSMKVACEREADAAMPGRSLIVRPGLIVGPYDPSDRFTYWVDRAARGGDMLAPGDPRRHVQVIHGRDLSEWMLTMAERGAGGIYNASGPSVAFEDVLAACRDAARSDARPVWVDEAWLTRRGVEEWSDLPVWIAHDSEFRHLFFPDLSKAHAAGLTSRSMTEIAGDVLAWHRTRGRVDLAAGLAAERESALLADWRNEARKA